MEFTPEEIQAMRDLAEEENGQDCGEEGCRLYITARVAKIILAKIDARPPVTIPK